METTISLGKIDYDNCGRKNCLVTLDIKISYEKLVSPYQDINHKHYETTHKLPTLSICGNVRQPDKKDIKADGQIADIIAEYFKNDLDVMQLVNIWRVYHLNNRQAGCAHQKIGNCNDDEIMSQICPETGYKYGSAWLYKHIPFNVIFEIERLCHRINKRSGVYHE